MSWDDIFGAATKKISPVAVTIPRDKSDRDRFINAMSKDISTFFGKDWDTMPGDDKITWRQAMEKLLCGLEGGRYSYTR